MKSYSVFILVSMFFSSRFSGAFELVEPTQHSINIIARERVSNWREVFFSANNQAHLRINYPFYGNITIGYLNSKGEYYDVVGLSESDIHTLKRIRISIECPVAIEVETINSRSVRLKSVNASCAQISQSEAFENAG